MRRHYSNFLTKNTCGGTAKWRSIPETLELLNTPSDQSISTPNKNFNKPIGQEKNAPSVRKDEEIIAENPASVIQNSGEVRFKVVWGKASSKKHKTFEGDGLITITEKTITLYSEDGAVIGSKSLIKPLAVEIGQIISLGSKEVQIIEPADPEPLTLSRKRPNEDPVSRPAKLKKKCSGGLLPSTSSTGSRQFVGPQAKPFCLPQPPAEHQWKYNLSKLRLVDVCVEGFLSLRLRPHQKEGVCFLYRCVMGYTQRHTGAILADEMGLGKTLQCIALIWTLLKHGPYGKPIIRRALVITPSTLCSPWRQEFLKWLGRERLLPFLVDNTNKPRDFLSRPDNTVMIISYERFVKHYSEIQAMKFDLLVCDEAHRLKNANIKSAQSIAQLSCTKRILLTGTPIQNNLQEYFVLVDIANPGILGMYNEFKLEYEDPILNSQKPDCDEEEKLRGEESSAKLQLLTSSFILRRTQKLLEDFLPSKTECVVCCKMTESQEKLYSAALEEWWGDPETPSSSPLSFIVLLKKICNYPPLVKVPEQLDEEIRIGNRLEDLMSQSQQAIEHSGKLTVLKGLVHKVVLEKLEKIVIVSCSTQLLDVLGNMCNDLQVKYSRLDGSTPLPQRQSVVDCFNRSGGPPVLLLSTRAGGAGLSLPAASRLVLYDSDWNPAVDRQAMARVWRDGQRRPVYIYRFLTTGTIEEKIYQRQMYKTGLSDATMDPNNVKSTLKMSTDELKDLFTLSLDCESSTHDLLQCHCPGDGSTYHASELPDDEEDTENKVVGQLGVSTAQPIVSSINQLKSWGHYANPFNIQLIQELGLENVIDRISFLFHKVYLKKNNTL